MQKSQPGGTRQRNARSSGRTALVLAVGSSVAVTAACGGGATAAAPRPAAATLTVTAPAAGAGASTTAAATKKAAAKKAAAKKAAARKTAGSGAAGASAAAAAVTPSGLGACPKSPLAAAPASSGKAPVQYGGKWTKGPTQGCSVTDQQGRKFAVTAEQNRMLYRVNEMRTIQNRKDRKKRAVLKMDFCLQELAQDYTNGKPRGHNPFLMKMYRYPSGRGAATGSSWIGENLGAHGGYTSNRMAMVDMLVYGWYTSGTLTSGHYGNMMDPNWTRAGFGIVLRGSSALSIQNFSAHPAYYAYPGGKKCTKPPAKKYGDSTVPPIGLPPD